jgi:hypothetical protein
MMILLIVGITLLLSAVYEVGILESLLMFIVIMGLVIGLPIAFGIILILIFG